MEGGLDINDYAYVKDPINEFDLDGNGFCVGGHNPKKKGEKHGGCRGGRAARGIARNAGRVSTIAGRGAVVLGVRAVVVGTGGTAGALLLGGSVALGLVSTGAAAAQWGAGAVSRDQCSVRSGRVGTVVGLLTLGTWGAVSSSLVKATTRTVRATNAYGALSRQGLYEAVGHSC